jgi:hypothetical protein
MWRVGGYKAGGNLTTGSNNVDINNQGTAGEANTIRIGTQGTQAKAFMAGITGQTLSGAKTVVISSTGQLGVGSAPATATTGAQVGVPAAQVARVLPSAAHLHGRVSYRTLSTLLLAELKRQAGEMRRLQGTVTAQGRELGQLHALQVEQQRLEAQLARMTTTAQ